MFLVAGEDVKHGAQTVTDPGSDRRGRRAGPAPDGEQERQRENPPARCDPHSLSAANRSLSETLPLCGVLVPVNNAPPPMLTISCRRRRRVFERQRNGSLTAQICFTL